MNQEKKQMGKRKNRGSIRVKQRLYLVVTQILFVGITDSTWWYHSLYPQVTQSSDGRNRIITGNRCSFEL